MTVNNATEHPGFIVCSAEGSPSKILVWAHKHEDCMPMCLSNSQNAHQHAIIISMCRSNSQTGCSHVDVIAGILWRTKKVALSALGRKWYQKRR
jgi:hypothetical protein